MFDKAKEKLETLKNDTKDTLDEVKQRAQAGAEHLKRGAEGDSMPIGERIVSNVKEALHNTKGDIDAAKRDVRHDAEDGDDKA
jgi:F0F1-type ATP synthase membrane subunit b/b'